MPCTPLLRRLALAVLLAALGAAPAAAFKRTFKGEALKDFELDAVAGPALRLADHLGAKATVVIFWASWSPRSAEALGEFQELYAEHRDAGLQVVAVNVEHQELGPEQRRSIATFAAAKELTYPVLVDEGLEVFNAYGVIAVPSLVLADGEGRILELLEGYSHMTRCDFRDRVLEALGLWQPPDEGPPEVSAYCPVGKAARYYQMGTLFLHKKMPGRAVKALRRAVQEDPNYAEAYVLLADALESRGKAGDAAAARERAAALGMPRPPPAAPGQGGEGAPAPGAASAADGPAGGAGRDGVKPPVEGAALARGRAGARPAPAAEGGETPPAGKERP